MASSEKPGKGASNGTCCSCCSSGNCSCCCCMSSSSSSSSCCSSVAVGRKAPGFKCQAVMPDGKITDLSLESFKGRYVLLFFYPFDFTFVCPSEIVAFNKALAEFESRNVQVLGCSIDSAFTHTAWRNTELKNGGIGRINYPLLADVNKTICRNYGVLLPEGMSLRGLFLIDREQIVQHALINNNSIGRSVEEALRVIDAVQFHEKHGEVCPANWKKGAKGMQATPAGVAEYLATQM